MASSRSAYLISVNKTPARAAMLVDQLLQNLNAKEDVVHIANSPTIENLKTILEALVTDPEVIICSSQWTEAEQDKVVSIATAVIPNIKTIKIPPGLDVLEGGEGVVRFLQQAFKDAGYGH